MESYRPGMMVGLPPWFLNLTLLTISYRIPPTSKPILVLLNL